MKDIYDLFIKCAKNRDYESVAWILNYVDPKALHDLISKMNPTSDVDGDCILISLSIRKFATLSWSIDSGYVTISVNYSKDVDTSVKFLIKKLYPKFKNIALNIELRDSTDSFSIVRCSPLEDCVYSETSNEYIYNPDNSEESTSN